MRALVFVYGLVSYVLFLGVFLYAIGFVGGLAVPKGLNDGAVGDASTALLVDAALLSVFAIQHSVMARPQFKERWTEILPEVVERSTFVLVTNALLVVLFWQWRPLPEVVWSLEGPAALVLWALFWAGWGIVLVSTFMIDHFDLFGLRQVTLHLQGKPYTAPRYVERYFYRHVRHPIMLGFLVAFWAAPVMTQGRLLFAVLTTGYVLVAIRIEERDLLRAHGDAYQAYRNRVSMLLPLGKRKRPV